jgi:hypothetical protein
MLPKKIFGPNRRAAAMGAGVWALLWMGCNPTGEGPRGMSTQSASLEIPCDANRVLQDVCQHCHSSPTQNGAPFSLVTYEDTQVPASGEPLWKYMRAVVLSGAMPLPPVQISPAQRDVLLAWFDAGAPPRSASDTCSDPSSNGADADTDADDASSGDDSDGGLNSREGGDAPDMDASDSDALNVDAAGDSGDGSECDNSDVCATDVGDAQTE